MTRTLRLAGAQMGPNQKADSREAILARMIALLEQAAAAGAKMVVFPELPLTTFFPRWYLPEQADVDAFFEREMPGPETRRLFDAARWLGIGFCLGYAELLPEPGRARHFGGRLQGLLRRGDHVNGLCFPARFIGLGCFQIAGSQSF